jgi:two-component system phosphate regulon sensor histidine kinase PhoR
LNLLDNAIHYSPQGGRIAIAATTEGAKGQELRSPAHPLTRSPAQYVVISIGDSGPGIAPEHLPRLFDRFFRADRGRNRAQGGSGLGLAIAQSIARRHGGRLEVASVVGQGSTFTAILPGAGASIQAQTRFEPSRRQDATMRQSHGQ